MFKADVLRKFGTQRRAAEAAGVTQPRVSQWRDVVPELPARRIHAQHPDIPLHENEHYPQARSA